MTSARRRQVVLQRLAAAALLVPAALMAAPCARAADATPAQSPSAAPASVKAPPAPPTTPAAGTIAGSPWAIGDSVIRPTSTRGELEIDLIPVRPGKASQAVAADGETRVLIGVPRKTGSFAIGAAATCTFVTATTRNLVATKGTIVIDKLDAAQVSGSVDCGDGADSSVRGRFTAQLHATPEDAHAVQYRYAPDPALGGGNR